MRKVSCTLLFWFLLSSVPCFAENYVLQGQMGSEINYELQQQVKRAPGTQKLVLSFNPFKVKKKENPHAAG